MTAKAEQIDRQLSLPLADWRPIPFAPGYEVSEAGTVRRGLHTKPGRNTYPGKILKPAKYHHGYTLAALYVEGKLRMFKIHALVLRVFGPPKPFPKAETRHLDGNPANNHISNLVWSTHFENEADKRRHGTLRIGEKNPQAKYTEQDIKSIRRDYAEFQSFAKVAAIWGISAKYVRQIVLRKCWTHVD